MQKKKRCRIRSLNPTRHRFFIFKKKFQKIFARKKFQNYFKKNFCAKKIFKIIFISKKIKNVFKKIPLKKNKRWRSQPPKIKKPCKQLSAGFLILTDHIALSIKGLAIVA